MTTAENPPHSENPDHDENPETTRDTMDTEQPQPGPDPRPEPATEHLSVPATPATTRPEPARGMRVGTTVWGLIIAAVGVGLLAVAAGAVFDVELAFIALVTIAGVALLVGSVVTGSRRRGH